MNKQNYKAHIKRVEFNNQNHSNMKYQSRPKQVSFALQNNIIVPKSNHQTHSTHQPKYNFTYGQNYGNNNNNYPHKNDNMAKQIIQKNTGQMFQQKSHIQFLNNTKPEQETKKFSFRKQQVQRFSVYKSRSRPRIWQRSSSQKKKLKIFPDNYQEGSGSKSKVNQTTIVDTAQLQKIRKQLQSLKQEIKKKSQPIIIPTNTKSTFSDSNHFSLSNSNQFQLERTKRLKQLQFYNESLYNELALKLKDLASEEYQQYLQINNANRVFLDEIFEHSQIKGKQKNQQEFIDINDFQQQYQFQYNESKRLSKDRSSNKKSYQHQNEQEDVINSPFLLTQNNENPSFFASNTKKEEFSPTELNRITSNYTFYKGSRHPKHHNQGTFKLSKIVQQNPKNQLPNVQIQQIQNIEYNPQKNISFITNKGYGIEDLNRNLEDKILRKRIRSEIGGYVISEKHSRIKFRQK